MCFVFMVLLIVANIREFLVKRTFGSLKETYQEEDFVFF